MSDQPIDKGVFDIAEEIYRNDPKDPFQIRIAAPEENDPNMIFEIISLILLEGINKKVLPVWGLIDPTDVDKQLKFIDSRVSLLKRYMKSCCFDLDIKPVAPKEFENFKFTKQPIFYVKNTYMFDMCFLVDIEQTRFKGRGKTKYLYYNPHKYFDVPLTGKYLVIKLNDEYFKCTFDFLKF